MAAPEDNHAELQDMDSPGKLVEVDLKRKSVGYEFQSKTEGKPELTPLNGNWTHETKTIQLNDEKKPYRPVARETSRLKMPKDDDDEEEGMPLSTCLFSFSLVAVVILVFILIFVFTM
ncbi:hypothetical protein C0J52_15016 [Blattella germanica]|nr:hypothetical protein C0J52_15016 [Blattella germanica]